VELTRVEIPVYRTWVGGYPGKRAHAAGRSPVALADPWEPTPGEVELYALSFLVNRTQARRAVRELNRSAMVEVGRALARLHGRQEACSERLALALATIDWARRTRDNS